MTGGAPDFAERLAAPTPTPGGGAAAARVALYASSLLRMVLGIELARRPDAEGGVDLEAWREEAARLADELRRLEVADMSAFEGFLEALRLPRQSEEEKAARTEARRGAARIAARVPVEILARANDLLAVAAVLRRAAGGRPFRADSDLVVAAELAWAACRAARHTAEANCPELPHEEAAALRTEVATLAREGGELHAFLTGGAES